MAKDKEINPEAIEVGDIIAHPGRGLEGLVLKVFEPGVVQTLCLKDHQTRDAEANTICFWMMGGFVVKCKADGGE